MMREVSQLKIKEMGQWGGLWSALAACRPPNALMQANRKKSADYKHYNQIKKQ